MNLFDYLTIDIVEDITVITMKHELTTVIAAMLIDYIIDNDIYQYRMLDMNGHQFRPTSADVKFLAKYDNRMPKKNYGAWAITNDDQLTFGTAREYASWRSDNEHCTVGVFYTFMEAFNWLSKKKVENM